MTEETAHDINIQDARDWLNLPSDPGRDPLVVDGREERIIAFIRKAVDAYERTDEILQLRNDVCALRMEQADTVRAVNDLIDIVKPHVDDLIPTIENLMNHPMVKLLGRK